MPVRKTEQEFKQEAKIKHNNFYDYTDSKYKNNKTPILIGCPLHGDFKQRPDSHLQGKGCNKCGVIKNKKTCQEKYGVDNVFQSENIKEKSKETCLEKYGFKYASQSEEVKQKMKKTCQEKYGVDDFRKSEEYKIKSKKTYMEKYGFEHSSKSEEVKQKMKKTCQKKYSVDNVFQLEEVKSKIKNTHLSKYKTHYTKTEEYKTKVKNTCKKLYNTDSYFEYYYNNNERNSDEILNKIKETKIKNGHQIDDSLLSNWDYYKKIVLKLTKRNKKELIANWSGYDYYDNEFILNNFSLNSTDLKYPTIDHLISIYYGFHHNIIPRVIANINNLAVTKYSINCKKGKMNEQEFKKKMDDTK